MTVTKLLTWDWKETPNINNLNDLVSEVSKNKCFIQEVEDTHGDMYAVIISDKPLDDDATQAAFEDHYADDE